MAKKSEQFCSLIVLHVHFSGFRTKGPDPLESNSSVMELMTASGVPGEVFIGVIDKPRANSHGKQKKRRLQGEDCG